MRRILPDEAGRGPNIFWPWPGKVDHVEVRTAAHPQQDAASLVGTATGATDAIEGARDRTTYQNEASEPHTADPPHAGQPDARDGFLSLTTHVAACSTLTVRKRGDGSPAAQSSTACRASAAAMVGAATP